MEKIKLGSGKELELITCGILTDAKTATIKFLPGEDSLDTLNDLLTSTAETNKMTLLSEGGEEQAIYNNYTELQSIRQDLAATVGYTEMDGEQTPVTGRLVTAVLHKPDTTEQRITSLEETVDTLVMESLGL